MIKFKLRRKILNKIAQIAAINAPMPQLPEFHASLMYPNINKGYNTASITLLNQLANIINMALHYSSFGKINMQMLKNSNFLIDHSKLPSIELKNIVLFSKKMFTELFNMGAGFTKELTPDEIILKVNKLSGSSELSNLPSTNISGPLAQKIQGNLKTIINSLLLNLKTINYH